MSNTPSQKQILNGCRHFTGILNPHCKAGVEYKQFLGKGGLPCLPRLGMANDKHCDQFAYSTIEEIDAEELEINRIAAQFLRKLAANICPHCDTPIERRVKVGRCVYSRPCGCRLYQGELEGPDNDQKD